jgi:hypothetical protein
MGQQREASAESVVMMPEHDGLRDVHLHEYSALSAAIADATKRIETIRGLYVAAAFATIVAASSKDSGYIAARISQLRSDQYLLTCVLLVPFLNSLLLVYVASLMHFILAAARYNTYSLRPSIEKLVNGQALHFDIWSSNDKRAWLFLRSAVGVLFYVLSTCVSIAILCSFPAAGQFKVGAVPGVAFIVSVGVVAFSVIVGLGSLVISKGFHKAHDSKFLQPRYLYWATVPVAIALYIFLMR